MVAAKSEVSAHTRRALVVDDSRIARYILSGLLARYGFEVDLADSGECALRMLAGPLPDVVFLDHLLPGMDGLETVDQLRRQSRTAHLPVVMYTSQESKDFADRAIRAGADDIFTKTSDKSRLDKILQKLDLLPETRQAAVSKVVPLDSREPAHDPARSNRARITRASLAKLLEPSLEMHHARLHQELLAEFAILERYEERMRSDLFSRVDDLKQHATDRVDRAFAEHEKESRRRQRRAAFGGWAMAATVLLGFALSLGAIGNVDERARRLESDTAKTLATLDARTQAIDALSIALLEAGRSADAATSDADFGGAPAVVDPADSPQGQVADDLVWELQSMGILGPVRIETAAGSFCITSGPGGFGIEASNLALGQCESLPVQLGANGF